MLFSTIVREKTIRRNTSRCAGAEVSAPAHLGSLAFRASRQRPPGSAILQPRIGGRVPPSEIRKQHVAAKHHATEWKEASDRLPEKQTRHEPEHCREARPE